ncbi:MAG: glycosyltransferase family 87 protein [Candidatus Thorarchaeota archaeon]
MSWIFLAITIIIHVVFISSLLTGILNPFFHDTRYITAQGIDFFAFYQAGNNVLNGLVCYARPDTLAVPYMFPYRYLAYFAYTFGALFNLMPAIQAYWTWVVIVLICVWLAAWRTRSVSKSLQREDWEGRIAMGMWFVFSPIYIELYLGQVTFMAAILMFFALTTPSMIRGKKGNWTMTTFWTIGSLMKLIPFFIAPVLIRAGRTRSVVASIMVLLFGIFAVPAGLDSLRYFLEFNTPQLIHVNPYIGNHSLKMLLYYVLGEPSGNFEFITGLLIGIFLMITIITTFYSRDIWVCAGMFSLLFFFIMFDVWEHHYTFLLPLFVLGWIRGRSGDKSRWVPLILILFMSIPMLPIVEFLSGIGPGVHPINLDSIWLIMYHSSKVFPALIFYVWLLLMAFRSPRKEGFLKRIRKAYPIAWKSFLLGRTPVIEEGILVQNEQETETHDM